MLKFLFPKPNLDLGILILRLGIGASMMVHGFPKIAGGTERWTKLGGAMKWIGIDFLPTFWGFMAAFAEFFGGLLLIFGAFMPITSILLGFTMFVAGMMHLQKDGLNDSLNAFELMFVFIATFFIGAGKYSVDEHLKK